MSIAYSTKVNKRPVGGELFISAEQHTIGISGAFLSTPDRIRLIEVPLQEVISSVSIPGYTEIPINGPAPTGFQFAVDYSIGRIYFAPGAHNGSTVFVSYKGRGSEVDSEDINELDIPVGIALNSDGSLVNGIVHPANISTVGTDDFSFPRDVSVFRNLSAGGNAVITGTISEGGSTLTINTAEIGSPTLDAQFIVNRGSSTPVSLRWNETLDAWEFLDNVTPVFQFYNSGAFSLTGPIHLGDGTASAPSYSFSSATNLGIYKSAVDTLGFATVGVEQWRIGSSGNLTSENSGVLRTGDGTVSAPGVAFTGDAASGIYRIGVSDIAIATGGIKALEIDSAQRAIFSSTGGSGLRVYGAAGTHQWDMYLNGTDLRFSDNTTGGKVQIDTDVAVSGKIYNSNGAALTPSYTFSSDTGTGISLPFAQNLLFSISGIGEVARFTSVGDFQLLEGEKLIMDGVGNAFLRFTSSTSMYGQTSNLGGFSFGSANELVLFANSVFGEPKLSMLTDGTITLQNSTQGTNSTRALKLEVSQQFSSGYHRTFQLFPSDAGLGTAATGTVTVVNYAALSGATLTVNGVALVEGSQWTASVDNNTTASSLAAAIALSTVATGAAVANVITITANTPGVAGNSITLVTSDPVNLTTSGATLSGGADDFVVALGYKANGTTVSAGTIDTHNSLPLIVTVNDTEMMEVTTSVVDVKNHNIQNVADPVNDTDAANKRYVNNVAAGLDPKASCAASTTGSNLTVTPSGSGVGKTLTATVNGVLTLDGISTWTDMVNDGGVNDPFSTSAKASRVLVKDQTIASDNGIYAVQQKGDGSHPFILVRATDFDGSPTNEVSGGNFTFIEQGTNLAGTGWVVVASGTITVDTNPINWTQFSTGAIPILAADPGAPTMGRVWFNSTDGQFKGYNGSSVVIMG